MKNSGLQNRFNKDRVGRAWAFHHRCLWCEKTGFNAFHHIISPSSQKYQKGKFNKSILNSYPIHNHKCHLYNSALHKLENEKKMLKKVLWLLMKTEMEFNEIDKEFFRTYKELYGY